MLLNKVSPKLVLIVFVTFAIGAVALWNAPPEARQGLTGSTMQFAGISIAVLLSLAVTVMLLAGSSFPRAPFRWLEQGLDKVVPGRDPTARDMIEIGFEKDEETDTWKRRPTYERRGAKDVGYAFDEFVVALSMSGMHAVRKIRDVLYALKSLDTEDFEDAVDGLILGEITRPLQLALYEKEIHEHDVILSAVGRVPGEDVHSVLLGVREFTQNQHYDRLKMLVEEGKMS